MRLTETRRQNAVDAGAMKLRYVKSLATAAYAALGIFPAAARTLLIVRMAKTTGCEVSKKH